MPAPLIVNPLFLKTVTSQLDLAVYQYSANLKLVFDTDIFVAHILDDEYLFKENHKLTAAHNLVDRLSSFYFCALLF